MALSEPADTLTPDAADVSDSAVAGLAPVEAARRLGVRRLRIYDLVQQGELDDSGGAWAILVLASTDAAFRAHVAGRRSPWEQSRAWLSSRIAALSMPPRVCARAV